MGLSAALETGKAGLRIYQVAMEVTSENIANVNTEGYSRQRVILESAPPTTHNGFPLGTGVKISTVERYYDALLLKQLVGSETTSSYDSKELQVLQQIEPIFNEVAQDGLGAAISGFFNAWQDLSLNPTGNAERQSVISAGNIMADYFHYTARTLNEAAISQNEAVEPAVNEVNNLLEKIAQLNRDIRATEQVYGNANEMKDRRDYFIRELSKYMEITLTENADGTTDVTYADTTGSYSLVKGGVTATFSVQVDGTLDTDGSTPKNVVWIADADGNAAKKADPTTGSLGATLVMRDTTIPDYLKKVDDLAEMIVDKVNIAHKDGFDLTNGPGVPGAPGGDFFVDGNIKASNILVAISSTNEVAASKDAASLGDNSNARAIAGLFNEKTMSGGTTTFGGYYNGLVAQIGLDVNAAKTRVFQDNAFMRQLQTLRDSYSGVSLDEELTDLIKYQRSYQASAKIITTVDSMMETLLQMV